MNKNSFTYILMHWHKTSNSRQMPWKGEKDPYKIWLSEIILQQTRVEQGWHYYEKFIQQYPTIQQLALAKDDHVFKLWEGLGYYNRCKNLLNTARHITKEYNGKFPEEYNDILDLKGIGPYTAAAISSFAYNKPFAVVDGNVFRVLSRMFCIETPIDSIAGKKVFADIAYQHLDKNEPGFFNQAIMDFGATICKPALPNCSSCPMNKICLAYNQGKVNLLPIKEKLLQKQSRWFTYFLFQHNGTILTRKRTGKDIWQNLDEFYLLETNEKPNWSKNAIHEWLTTQFNISDGVILHISPLIVQQLTHQLIKGYFIRVEISSIPLPLQINAWHNASTLAHLTFPKFIHQYLETSSFQSSLF